VGYFTLKPADQGFLTGHRRRANRLGLVVLHILGSVTLEADCRVPGEDNLAPLAPGEALVRIPVPKGRGYGPLRLPHRQDPPGAVLPAGQKWSYNTA
jgi:hypothetical protein